MTRKLNAQSLAAGVSRVRDELLTQRWLKERGIRLPIGPTGAVVSMTAIDGTPNVLIDCERAVVVINTMVSPPSVRVRTLDITSLQGGA